MSIDRRAFLKYVATAELLSLGGYNIAWSDTMEKRAGTATRGRVDYIVIGAGINALSAAVLLGQAGRSVLVLERNPEPGGAVRTLELTLPGFYHEFGATNLVLGDINAGSQHLSQFYGQRPFPQYPHYAMPIPRIYMCGASTWPGSGANPTSGTLLAQRLLGDDV